MTRSELRILSDAHAVALAAMVVPETRAPAPFAAALALSEAAGRELPSFAPCVARFVEDLRASHGRAALVAAAGRTLRNETCRAMAFVPVDADRKDLYG